MRMGRGIRRAGLGVIALALSMAATGAHAGAATSMLLVRAYGRSASVVTPGTRIAVTAHRLPATRHAYCLGLASVIDRYALPLNLGRVRREASGDAHVAATIPVRLLPAEPAGPYLLFVGACTPIAPDHPFVAQVMIRIVGKR